MSNYNKPGIKFQPPDWFINSIAISSNSQRQRNASQQIREDCRSLRLAAALRTKWDEFNNTTRLADRIDGIKDFRDILDLAHSQLDNELLMVNSGKTALEEQICNIVIPKDCVTECLTLRDWRRGIDTVQDISEIQLEKEKELLNICSNLLQQKVDEAFEMMVFLKEVRSQVLIDLQHKNDAIDIDLEQYKLTPHCPGVSYKIDPTRIPPGTTTLQQWEEFTRNNWQKTQSVLRDAERLREIMYNTLCKTSNDIEAQQKATDFAIRRRRHEISQALHELNWQKQQTENEIIEMEADLHQLEISMNEMIPMDKLAQTRLERRTRRPGADLCRDQVQYGLTDEVRQIEVTNEALYEQQLQARHALDALHRQLNRINDDIKLKEQSLDLENNCIYLRHKHLARPNTDHTELMEPVDPMPKLMHSKYNHPPTFVDPKIVEKLLV